MFYRQHKTLWYQFCNFKHFLKAENSEDSLASSCVELSIGLSCNLDRALYRKNVSFRDRDLKRQIPCHTASENLDAQLLRNDTSFLSNLLCKSPLINYSPTIFVRLFQPIH